MFGMALSRALLCGVLGCVPSPPVVLDLGGLHDTAAVADVDFTAIKNLMGDPAWTVTPVHLQFWTRHARTLDRAIGIASALDRPDARRRQPVVDAAGTASATNLNDARAAAVLLGGAARCLLRTSEHDRGVRALIASCELLHALGASGGRGPYTLSGRLLPALVREFNLAVQDDCLDDVDCARLAPALRRASTGLLKGTADAITSEAEAWLSALESARVPESGRSSIFDAEPLVGSGDRPFVDLKAIDDESWMRESGQLRDVLRKIRAIAESPDACLDHAARLLEDQVAAGIHGKLARAVLLSGAAPGRFADLIDDRCRIAGQLRDCATLAERLADRTVRKEEIVQDQSAWWIARIVEKVAPSAPGGDTSLDKGGGWVLDAAHMCERLREADRAAVLDAFIARLPKLRWDQGSYWGRRGQGPLGAACNSLVALKLLAERARCDVAAGRPDCCQAIGDWLAACAACLGGKPECARPLLQLEIAKELERQDVLLRAASSAPDSTKGAIIESLRALRRASSLSACGDAEELRIRLHRGIYEGANLRYEQDDACDVDKTLAAALAELPIVDHLRLRALLELASQSSGQLSAWQWRVMECALLPSHPAGELRLRCEAARKLLKEGESATECRWVVALVDLAKSEQASSPAERLTAAVQRWESQLVVLDRPAQPAAGLSSRRIFGRNSRTGAG